MRRLMMKLLSFFGEIRCRLGFHTTAGLQIGWREDNPAYWHTIMRCVRCHKVLEEAEGT